MMDYGKDIQVDTILEPVTVSSSGASSTSPSSSTTAADLDWRVPPNFDCDKDPTCFIAEQQYNDQNRWTMTAIERVLLSSQQGGVLPTLASIPSYRHAYSTSVDFFETRMGGFRDLTRTLPGFTMETGMACSLWSLISSCTEGCYVVPIRSLYKSPPALQPPQLSVTEAQQSPDNDQNKNKMDQHPNPLVLSLYIRTGRTENLSFHEATHTYIKLAESIVDCALGIESAAIVNADASELPYTHIVWMVVTDSHFLKTWIRDKYETCKSSNTTGTTSMTGGGLPRDSDYDVAWSTYETKCQSVYL
jgi:hypothetical protein